MFYENDEKVGKQLKVFSYSYICVVIDYNTAALSSSWKYAAFKCWIFTCISTVQDNILNTRWYNNNRPCYCVIDCCSSFWSFSPPHKSQWKCDSLDHLLSIIRKAFISEATQAFVLWESKECSGGGGGGAVVELQGCLFTCCVQVPIVSSDLRVSHVTVTCGAETVQLID